MLKHSKTILAGVAVTVAVVAAVAMLWISRPGQYRALLEDYVASATGYQLLVAGDIELELLPRARLVLADVRLRNPAFPRELASAAQIEFDVDRSDLLRGELTIDELRISDFHINAHVDAAGNSIWNLREAAGPDADGGSRTISASAGGSAGPELPGRIYASGGRLDYQNLRRSLRYQMKDISVAVSSSEPIEESFHTVTGFVLEWYDAVDARLREEFVALSGLVKADMETSEFSSEYMSITIGGASMALDGRIEVSGLSGNPRYGARLESTEFDARELLRIPGWLPETEPPPLSVPNVSREGQWLAAVALDLAGDADGFSAEATVSRSGRSLIEAETEVRFASGAAPTRVRYEMDIGELDIGPWLADREAESEAPGAANRQGPASPQSGRNLPGLENLNLSGSITADALTAGALQVDNLSVYTNVESRVFDLEVPPVAALGGSISANLRWNASSGEFTSEFHGEELVIAEIAPLITRLDVLSGRLQIDSVFNANGSSVPELLDSLRGDTSFVVTENLVNIGLIKQIFTSISALGPSGESVQQWPDQIRFAEVSGGLALDQGLGSEHSFNLRLDNFTAAGTGITDLQGEFFDYEVLITMLGEPASQTIPASRNYRGVGWPVECAANFGAEVIQFCRPDFRAVREIFSRIGANARSN